MDTESTQELVTPTQAAGALPPAYHLCSTDDSARWLLVVRTSSGGMHLLYEGDKATMTRLRDMMASGDTTWAG